MIVGQSSTAYEWAPGSRIKVPACVAGEVCEVLRVTVGLTPENLVAASEPEDAPLHDAFEWDNEKAAEQYRLQQGRHIIASIVVRPIPSDPNVVTRLYVHTEPHTYEHIDVVLKDSNSREILLRQAKADWKIFERKYRVLNELVPLFKEGETIFG